MKIPLKFKAWDSINRQMHSNVSVFSDGKTRLYGSHWTLLKKDYPTMAELDEAFKAIEHGIIVLQYTGRHDKKGVEAYDGDIVRTPSGQILLIQISDLINGDSKFRAISVAHCEIIGNIYPNPELLGAK